MISLAPSKDPYEIDLPYGIILTVKPLTTHLMLRAQLKARKKVEESSPTDDLENEALYQETLIEELAISQIAAWQGVADETGEKSADVTPENVKALMALYPIGERFFAAITLKQMLMHAAKKE